MHPPSPPPSPSPVVPTGDIDTNTTLVNHQIARVFFLFAILWHTIILTGSLSLGYERILESLCLNSSASGPPEGFLPTLGAQLATLRVFLFLYGAGYWFSGASDDSGFTLKGALFLTGLDTLLVASVLSWVAGALWLTATLAVMLNILLWMAYGWLVSTTRPRRFSSFLTEAIIAFFTSLVGEFLLPLALFASTGETGNPAACHELERRWLMALPFVYVNIAMLVMTALSDYSTVWSGGAAWTALGVYFLDQSPPYIRLMAGIIACGQIVGCLLIMQLAIIRLPRTITTRGSEVTDPEPWYIPSSLRNGTPKSLCFSRNVTMYPSYVCVPNSAVFLDYHDPAALSAYD